ncbi:MAG: 4-hydroxy-3-methylbut-2-enyl diphosphate reductase [Verrucomicrobiales bacterium]|nr:4-hydroxy-3-methylbut-2-enyl diphosphate reductase [Verrucomicrobiales bacterium]
MKINLATHYGMCFGVRDAIQKTHEIAQTGSAAVLGELVHNPVVRQNLDDAGVSAGTLDDDPGSIAADAVIFTAHGVADSVRKSWSESGKEVFDTTCPLVRKAHRSLECLVLAGFKPVVIGRYDHVEVRGLVTDFPDAVVVLDEADFSEIPGPWDKIGVVSQTTQPVTHVEELVSKLRASRPAAEVRFIDTVCQPTKDRQSALQELAAKCDTIVVVGGSNSNNTRQLAVKAEGLGCRSFHVESPDDLKFSWFVKAENVGVTAGTSTLDETVQAVVRRLEKFSAEKRRMELFDTLKEIA